MGWRLSWVADTPGYCGTPTKTSSDRQGCGLTAVAWGAGSGPPVVSVEGQTEPEHLEIPACLAETLGWKRAKVQLERSARVRSEHAIPVLVPSLRLADSVYSHVDSGTPASAGLRGVRRGAGNQWPGSLLVTAVGRVPRYFAEAYLAAEVGEHSPEFLHRHPCKPAVVALGLFLLVPLLVKLRGRLSARPSAVR